MGLLTKKQINKNSILAVWEIKESLELLISLSSQKTERDVINTKRKKEWLATRLLLKEINSKYKIFYNKYGAPQILNKDISISHTHRFIAIIISNNTVGIDIQEITETPLNIASRFIDIEKHKNLNNEKATLIWSAKECLFKIHQIGNLNYIRDLSITPFQIKKKGELNTYLYTKKYKLHYEKIDNHYLVYFCK
ncbi:MAG: 4'-phosphopantetheinyl transferase superfamily protein [Bacteroidota bacterium]|nr:4'-phosphopantetheinyl transferase superfamily protein [Bacteroidota bacterium]